MGQGSTAVATASLPSRVFNNVLAPLFLMVTTMQLVPLLWYTNTQLDGSYARLIEAIGIDGLLETLGRATPAPTYKSTAIIASFAIFEVLLLLYVPTKLFYATRSPSGYQPIYRANGVQAFVITMVTLFGIHFGGIFNVASVYDELGSIYTTLVVSVFFFCWLLYLKGTFFPSHQSSHSTDYGTNGNIIMDYYWGMELYPHVGRLDLKHYFNCRFGMMAWPTLLTVYALKQYELYGYVSTSMLVSYGIQMVYLTKFYIWETGYMNTIDIMHDRFGYYICWGVCCYVPSLYTVCTQYLTTHPVDVPVPIAVALFLAGVIMIYIQYDVDTQRIQFRKHCTKENNFTIWGRKATFIVAPHTTTDGKAHESLLLTSGWWGLSRHINYFFEIFFTLLWVPPVQLDHVMPYSYVIFLTGLLVHRLFRDEERCAQKYGKAYERYLKAVPYYIVPGIF